MTDRRRPRCSSVEHVTVSFDGFKALNDLSFSLAAGACHVLVGPNGAGKSTLLDAIIGRVRPTSGRVVFKGEDLANVPEYAIVRRGICRKFQTPGRARRADDRGQPARRGDAQPRRVARADRLDDRRRSARASTKCSRSSGSPTGARSRPRELAHGNKQWLEIGMVVASDADLLLLDEPAAGMTHQEAEATAALIRSLTGRHAFIVIDHDMDFVEQLSAPVSVLNMGSMLAHGDSVEEIRRNPEVEAVYLGRAARGSTLLALENVGAAYGMSQVLNGIALTRRRRRSGRAARAQRRRQDDAAAHDRRPASRPMPAASPSTTRDVVEAARLPARALGDRLRAARSRHLSAADGRGKSVGRRLGARRANAGRRRRIRRRSTISFPALTQIARPQGRRAQRRRATATRAGPRAARKAAPAPARRAGRGHPAQRRGTRSGAS